MSTLTVSFSELSKNSKRVADAVEQVQRVHVTRRDGEDLYLTTERHDRQREETADVTARLFTALIGSDEGARAILPALPTVFPWARHLSAEEVPNEDHGKVPDGRGRRACTRCARGGLGDPCRASEGPPDPGRGTAALADTRIPDRISLLQ